VPADTVDHHYQERKEELPFQFGHIEDILQSSGH